MTCNRKTSKIVPVTGALYSNVYKAGASNDLKKVSKINIA